MTQDPPVTADTADGDEGLIEETNEVQVDIFGEQAEENCVKTGGQARTAG